VTLCAKLAAKPPTEGTPTMTITARKATAADGKAWAADALNEGVTAIAYRDYGGTGGVVLEVRVDFTPGDLDGYVAAENLASFVMSEVPTVAYGSRWGTTSDGVGGHSGLTSGSMVLLQSGVSKRFAKGATS